MYGAGSGHQSASKRGQGGQRGRERQELEGARGERGTRATGVVFHGYLHVEGDRGCPSGNWERQSASPAHHEALLPAQPRREAGRSAPPQSQQLEEDPHPELHQDEHANENRLGMDTTTTPSAQSSLPANRVGRPALITPGDGFASAGHDEPLLATPTTGPSHERAAALRREGSPRKSRAAPGTLESEADGTQLVASRDDIALGLRGARRRGVGGVR